MLRTGQYSGKCGRDGTDNGGDHMKGYAWLLMTSRKNEELYDSDTSMSLDMAKKWTSRMKNADGTSGEHWTYDQTNKVLRDKGFDCQSPEFYAAMNMLWSDYCKVAEKFGVNSVDFWAALAHAFLMDEDAKPGKLERYYGCVVEK